MRYYSDVTKQIYESEKELNQAEFKAAQAKENARKTKEKESAERKKAAAEVQEAYAKARVANAHASKVLADFCDKYGSYHFSVDGSEDSELNDLVSLCKGIFKVFDL
mgnify:CR=1 FL=1